MNNKANVLVTPDLWHELRQFTDARIGLGRAGSSLPLSETLNFKLAHAKARDAVHTPLDHQMIRKELEQAGIDCELLASRAENRDQYLTRPDLGRRLSEASHKKVTEQKKDNTLAIVACDGLSSRAIHENCVTLIEGLLQVVEHTQYTLAPVNLVENGRVAIGDEVGEILGAEFTLVLIGERPGLSSPNSLGAYLTKNPKVGTTDESRNCISNIRKGGLSTLGAVQKISYLIDSALRLGQTGVNLKDDMPPDYLPFNLKMGLPN